jgi:hypothetical protein
MAQPRITRDDVTSMVGARRELGDEMEPAVVDAFLDRVEAENGGALGVIAAWAGIAGINLGFSRQRRD